jgi:hypothetical protein
MFSGLKSSRGFRKQTLRAKVTVLRRKTTRKEIPYLECIRIYAKFLIAFVY